MNMLHNIQDVISEFGQSKLGTCEESKLSAYNNTPRKKVFEYDLSGNFVREYGSIMQFKIHNNIKIKVSSSHVTNRKTIGGKIVRFDKYDKLPDDLLSYHLSIKVYNPQLGKIQNLTRKQNGKS